MKTKKIDSNFPSIVSSKKIDPPYKLEPTNKHMNRFEKSIMCLVLMPFLIVTVVLCVLTAIIIIILLPIIALIAPEKVKIN